MQPVFIIGAGRSGTKYLRDTLSASPEVARIPYDVGYIWRHGNEGLEHDEIDADLVSEKDIRWIQKQLPKLRDKGNPKNDAWYLVEKSVPNSLRPKLLYKAFPDAFFIHLIRDGRAVSESAMRMWQTPPNRKYILDKLRYFPIGNIRYALWFAKNRLRKKSSNRTPVWGPRYKGVDNDIVNEPLWVVCAKQWKRCVEIASRQLSEVPPERVLTVRYEQLMNEDDQWIAICDALGISREPVLEEFRRTVKPGENQKWRKSLSENQLADIEMVFEELPDSLRRYTID